MGQSRLVIQVSNELDFFGTRLDCASSLHRHCLSLKHFFPFGFRWNTALLSGRRLRCVAQQSSMSECSKTSRSGAGEIFGSTTSGFSEIASLKDGRVLEKWRQGR